MQMLSHLPCIGPCLSHSRVQQPRVRNKPPHGDQPPQENAPHGTVTASTPPPWNKSGRHVLPPLLSQGRDGGKQHPHLPHTALPASCPGRCFLLHSWAPGVRCSRLQAFIMLVPEITGSQCSTTGGDVLKGSQEPQQKINHRVMAAPPNCMPRSAKTSGSFHCQAHTLHCCLVGAGRTHHIARAPCALNGPVHGLPCDITWGPA